MILTQIDRVILDQYQGYLGDAFAHFLRNQGELSQKPAGRYDGAEGFYYLIQEYGSKNPAEVLWESHQKYIDIQIICEGEELMEFADLLFLEKIEENLPKDRITWKGSAEGSMIFRKGGTAIFYPEDAHRPGLWVNGVSGPVRKVVYKVLFD